MSALKFVAYVCFGLAVIVAGIGIVATVQLINEYGENVRPLNLAAQAAVAWAPPTAVLAAVGYLCFRKVQRK